MLAAWQVLPVVQVDDVVQLVVQIFEVLPLRERHTRPPLHSESIVHDTPCAPESPG
jgi:hypothetical protein